MTREEAAINRIVAIAVLKYLAGHGSATFQSLQADMKGYEQLTLLRAIALASSKGGLCISIDKKMFGLVPDFVLVEVPLKILHVVEILERDISFTHEHETAKAEGRAIRITENSTEVVTTVSPFTVRPRAVSNSA